MEVCGEVEFEQGIKRVKIVVHVIFRDATELHLSKRLKIGTKKVDELTYESELYFKDGKAGEMFLNYKFFGTLEDWEPKSRIDDLLVGPEDLDGGDDDDE